MEKINWINGQSGGTPISAENLNLMQDNAENAINSLKSIVENLGVIEEQGEGYVRYSTGIQICWGQSSGTTSTTSYFSTLRSSSEIDTTFEKEFTTQPIVITQVKTNAQMSCQLRDVTTTGFKCYPLYPSGTSSTNYSFYYIAIGMWK